MKFALENKEFRRRMAPPGKGSSGKWRRWQVFSRRVTV